MKKSTWSVVTGLALATLLLAGCYKVTGGGRFTVSEGALYDADGNTLADLTGNQCTFAFTAQSTGEEGSEETFVSAKGEVQIVNSSAGIIFHGVVNETINDKYQSISPTDVGYWGSKGTIKIGKGKPVPVEGFQLNVSTSDPEAPTVFIGISGTLGMVLSGTLEKGNVVIHTE